jgi:hypothetical protein
MSIAVRAVDLRVLNMRTRMPFRYGIASMTALPHLFVRVEIEMDGQRQAGLASEGLPPKWFTKDPRTTFRDDLADMLRAIRHACALALEAGDAPSVFALWQRVHDRQSAWGVGEGYPPLLSGLGTSLVERAVIDAFCRATGRSFARAVREGTLGISLGAVHPELAGAHPADLLPAQPLRAIIVRHTIGLTDPLTDDDVPAGEHLDDGLPQSLAACIRVYGLTHFKIKLAGDTAKDLDRLERIARVLCGTAGERFAFTLDGNEQYHDVLAFRAFWRALTGEPSLAPFMGRLLFVEQPLQRDVALSADAGQALRAWEDRPAIIIDESDGAVESLPLALERGYAGTSYKNCKGVLRGIANACLIAHRNRAAAESSRDAAGRGYVLSGEDLANVGPVALLQDLAAMATLGIEHVERNGHHYFAGLSMLPEDVQRDVLACHGDLYRRHERGFPALEVHGGTIQVGSVVDAPFGPRFLLDVSRFTSLDEWRFGSLGLNE